MRRSKLQMYVQVLDALAFYGPMRLTRITYKANLNYSLLKPILEDLMKSELVILFPSSFYVTAHFLRWR